MILKLFTEDRKKIEAIGEPSASTSIIYHYLQKHPIAEAKKIVEYCKISLPTGNKSLQHLIDLGIVKEVTGKARNKIYVYQKYLDILNEGVEQIAGHAPYS